MMPLADAVAAADAAWVVAPGEASGQQVELSLVSTLRGTPVGTQVGSSPLVLLREGVRTCARELIGGEPGSFEVASAVLALGAPAERLTASVVLAAAMRVSPYSVSTRAGDDGVPVIVHPPLGGTEVPYGGLQVTLHADRPAEGPYLVVQGARYGEVSLVSVETRTGDCPSDRLVVLIGANAYGPVSRGGRHVPLAMPLRCVAPGIESACEVPWDGGYILAIHPVRDCPVGAVLVPYRGVPRCVEVQSCEPVPFEVH
jgi:hypothetical protein